MGTTPPTGARRTPDRTVARAAYESGVFGTPEFATQQITVVDQRISAFLARQQTAFRAPNGSAHATSQLRAYGSMVDMDPMAMIVGALASGAASGLTKVAGNAISDAYDALKNLIAKRYPSVSTAGVENKPTSDTQKGALQESLSDEGADTDAELLDAANKLLVAIKSNDPDAARAVGLDLTRVNAGNIDIERVRAAGDATAVRMTDVASAGNLNIKDVEADNTAGQTNRP